MVGGRWLCLMGVLVGCPTPIEDPAERPGSASPQAAYTPIQGDISTTAQSGQIRVIESPEKMIAAPKTQMLEAQARIRAGHHTTFSGEIVCSGCTGPFQVRVQAFITPRSGRDGDENLKPPTCSVGSHGANVEFPGIVVAKPGSFTIAIPWHGAPVVIEVVEDKNGDGMPSPGERLTVVHEDGAISGREDKSGIRVDFDATPMIDPGQVQADYGG